MRHPALPRPPYHVAILRYRRNGEDAAGYDEALRDIVEMAQLQPGFLGMESVDGEGGDGVTLSYWTDEASIRAWRAQDDQGVIREKDRRGWYAHYALQIARVERAYEWSRDEADDPEASETALPV
ncbi:antibiotic biosynthesis monooxygenase family protein [Luteimonas fraxinea]|uniref:antibiotic biosynthesis monooxygenase family protein n=1 Tax=Luteimonas fraxinea TaxID=2901869 RepID=UPI001E28B888|nr:antibiotic biosynthesis monooxygenase [Luteimonas fraxinea]MCD9127351.1 antibiotic biosynthesis monooxygenase [Luteimonas fraxinea]